MIVGKTGYLDKMENLLKDVVKLKQIIKKKKKNLKRTTKKKKKKKKKQIQNKGFLKFGGDQGKPVRCSDISEKIRGSLKPGGLGRGQE